MERAKGHRDSDISRWWRCVCTDCICGTHVHRHSKVCKDRDKQCVCVCFFFRFFFWVGPGAKSVWQENQRLHFFRVHTAYLSHSGFLWDCGRSLPLSVRTQSGEKKKRESHFLSTHEWAVSTCVHACVWDIVCVWLLYWHCSVIFDSNDVGPLQIDRRGKERMRTRWGKREKRATQPERNFFVTQWSKSGQKQMRICRRLSLSFFSPFIRPSSSSPLSPSIPIPWEGHGADVV